MNSTLRRRTGQGDRRAFPVWFVLSCPALTPGLAAAEPRDLTALIPADSLVVYAAQAYGSEGAPAAPPTTQEAEASPSISSIATIVSFLNATGLIPDEGQVFADIATALPLLGRFDHAMVLLDASSRVVETKVDPNDDEPTQLSLRLKRLQAAIIFRTAGDCDLVVNQLNRIVGRYTNRDMGRLTRHEVGELAYQRLADRRLTGWAVWEWGRLGDFYVVSFGEAAFERVAGTFAGRVPSLRDDSWFQSATRATHGDRALARWFIAMSRLQERLGTAAQDRFVRVTQALGAANMSHDLWTVGREGRALSWYRCYRRDGRNVTRRYSDPAAFLRRHEQLVPHEARHFAIVNVPTRWLVENLPRAWLASMSPGKVEVWQRAWARVEQDTGIDINGALIENLGEHVVIFDFPPHPLRVPFALTVAIEIRNREAVAQAIDALLGAWGRYLDERAERNDTTLVRMKVLRADDGLWYVQAGILGPALKVTENYVVLSWSPQALRDVLKRIETPHRASR